MGIVGAGREHQVCPIVPRDIFKPLLYLVPMPGKSAVRKIVQMIRNVCSRKEVAGGSRELPR